jgi:predicted RNA-binding protein with PIN domain
MHNVIVDGYNVIHAEKNLKRTMKSDIRGARQGLIELITSYLKRKNVQITLVFDGRGGLTDVEIPLPGKLQVLFSCTGQTADELILEILRRSSNPRRYTVVTSDMADIGRAARAMGSEIVPSSEFLERLTRQPDIKENGEQEPELADDVDYWMDKFSKRKSTDE